VRNSLADHVRKFAPRRDRVRRQEARKSIACGMASATLVRSDRPAILVSFPSLQRRPLLIKPKKSLQLKPKGSLQPTHERRRRSYQE
jgi:hypothetical protein